MTKISNSSSPDSFLQAQNAPKPVFGRSSAPDPAAGAYDAPPDPLVGWGGRYPLPIPLPLDAFGVSVLRPPQHKILATPVSSRALFGFNLLTFNYIMCARCTNLLLETPQTSASHSSCRMYFAPQSLAVAAFSDPAERVSASSGGSPSVPPPAARSPPPPRTTDTRRAVDGEEARTPMSIDDGRERVQRSPDKTAGTSPPPFLRRRTPTEVK